MYLDRKSFKYKQGKGLQLKYFLNQAFFLMFNRLLNALVALLADIEEFVSLCK